MVKRCQESVSNFIINCGSYTHLKLYHFAIINHFCRRGSCYEAVGLCVISKKRHEKKWWQRIQSVTLKFVIQTPVFPCSTGHCTTSTMPRIECKSETPVSNQNSVSLLGGAAKRDARRNKPESFSNPRLTILRDAQTQTESGESPNDNTSKSPTCGTTWGSNVKRAAHTHAATEGERERWNIANGISNRCPRRAYRWILHSTVHLAHENTPPAETRLLDTPLPPSLPHNHHHHQQQHTSARKRDGSQLFTLRVGAARCTQVWETPSRSFVRASSAKPPTLLFFRRLKFLLSVSGGRLKRNGAYYDRLSEWWTAFILKQQTCAATNRNPSSSFSTSVESLSWTSFVRWIGKRCFHLGTCPRVCVKTAHGSCAPRSNARAPIPHGLEAITQRGDLNPPKHLGKKLQCKSSRFTKKSQRSAPTFIINRGVPAFPVSQLINRHIFIFKTTNNPRVCVKSARPRVSPSEQRFTSSSARLNNAFKIHPESAAWPGRVWVRQEQSLPQQQPPCALGEARALSAQGSWGGWCHASGPPSPATLHLTALSTVSTPSPLLSSHPSFPAARFINVDTDKRQRKSWTLQFILLQLTSVRD